MITGMSGCVTTGSSNTKLGKILKIEKISASSNKTRVITEKATLIIPIPVSLSSKPIGRTAFIEKDYDGSLLFSWNVSGSVSMQYGIESVKYKGSKNER